VDCTNPNHLGAKKGFRSEEAGRELKLDKAADELVKMHDKEDFCREFIMLSICVYLAPTSGHILNRCYMDIFNNSEHIKGMNWPEFVVDYLIKKIEDFIKSTVTNVNIHGCVGILPVSFFILGK